MFELLKLTLREKKWVTLALISTIGVALFTTIFVNLVQPVIDEMFGAAPSATAAVTAAPVAAKARILDVVWKILHIAPKDIKAAIPFVLVAVIFAKGIFTFLSSFFMKAVGNKIVKRMRDDLYAHILRQSSGYFDRATTGDLMSRMTNDVGQIQQAVGTAMSDLIEESFVLLGLLAAVFINDWRMAIVAFVITPLAIIPMAAFSRQLKKQGRKSQMRMGEIYNLIHEIIFGNRIVKAFTMEGFELKKFLKSSLRYYRINLKLAWISSLSSPFMEFIGGVVAAVILYIGAGRIANHQISPGDFGSFAMTIFYMFTPIKRMSRANNVVQQAVASYDRIQEVLQTPPEIQDRPGAVPMPTIQGRIRFDRVGFSYVADRPVLFDVNFETKPRETVALVGLSGAGKTTIVNLIGRFYEATAGTITIDGIDIRDVTTASLRSQIGLVTQEIILFNDSVRANIAYGLDDVPLEKVIESAKAAECHDFIMELPQEYETPIGERGGILSVGQRQRLALARALLKDPPILILDEATSSLDSESERLIQQALTRIMKNRTTFIIAHRLSTIRNADTILVIDGGRIVESGTHDELVRKSRGIYRKLHDLQFPEEEENGG
jgi:subfamily B ATP-binding cassette protein MsbA